MTDEYNLFIFLIIKERTANITDTTTIAKVVFPSDILTLLLIYIPIPEFMCGLSSCMLSQYRTDSILHQIIRRTYTTNIPHSVKF